jgi:hypothetical protein
MKGHGVGKRVSADVQKQIQMIKSKSVKHSLQGGKSRGFEELGRGKAEKRERR